jgi:hypothetical protein
VLFDWFVVDFRYRVLGTEFGKTIGRKRKSISSNRILGRSGK